MSKFVRETVQPPSIPDGLEAIDPAGAGDAIEGVLLTGSVLGAADGGGPIDVRSSVLRQVRIVAARSLVDVELTGCDCSNARWAGARRVVVRDCRCTGLDAAGAVLTDVVFERCVLDMACFMDAELHRVWFEDCRVREADFDSARLDAVAWRSCDLRGARLVRTSLAGVDLRGSRVDGVVLSPGMVGGCTIEPGQADVFAAAMGLDVRGLGEG